MQIWKIIGLNIVALRVMKKRFPNGSSERHMRGGHFVVITVAAISLCRLQRLPYEMVEQILLAIELNPCYRRLFVQRPQWKYIYEKYSPSWLPRSDTHEAGIISQMRQLGTHGQRLVWTRVKAKFDGILEDDVRTICKVWYKHGLS